MISAVNLPSVLALASVLLCHVTAVTVDTEYGPIRGRTVTVDNTLAVTSLDEFRAVPYAKPPVGDLRFASPVAPDPWTDVLDVLEPGAVCPQDLDSILNTNPDWDRVSEDCLHMDIYSPDVTSPAGTYPVMVWIYGGSFQNGANIEFPGHILASHGVVVAVVNYRLNKFGFAFTGNDVVPGNAGLWDQNLALQFIVNNIGQFGGDPNKITIFGESAGAASASIQMVSPESKDLFQQAILESGTDTNMWSVNLPASQPETYTRQLAGDLGCDVPGDQEMVDCLRTIPMDDIIYNASISCTPGHFCLGMAPVIDGPGGILPDFPEQLREAGDIMRGPMMSCVLEDDGATFIPSIIPETMSENCCNRTNFKRFILTRLLLIWTPLFDPETEQDLTEAMDWFFLQWPDIDDSNKNRDSLARIMTDGNFGADWDKQLKAHSTVADTYGFVFDYRSELSSHPDWFGVTHGDEMDYVFGFPMMQFNPEIQNSSYLYVQPYNQDDIEYSLFVQQLFVNFARYGNPTFEEVQKPFGGGLTEWPRLTQDDLSVLYMAPEVSVVQNYRQQAYAFFEQYLRYIIYGTEPQAKDMGDAPFSIPGELLAAMTRPELWDSDSEVAESLALELLKIYRRAV